MDDQQQRDAVVSMQADMRHLLRSVDDIKSAMGNMATKGELALLTTKAEMAALINRVEMLEREVRDKSPGALWRTVTGVAAGMVTIGAAVALLVAWIKGGGHAP